MNHTTVGSNQENEKYTTSIAGSIFQATENTLEVPPKGQVYEVISSYIDEKGNLEITAGNASVDEKGLTIQDGTILTLRPEFIKAVNKSVEERKEKAKKIAQKGKTPVRVSKEDEGFGKD